MIAFNSKSVGLPKTKHSKDSNSLELLFLTKIWIRKLPND